MTELSGPPIMPPAPSLETARRLLPEVRMIALLLIVAGAGRLAVDLLFFPSNSLASLFQADTYRLDALFASAGSRLQWLLDELVQVAFGILYLAGGIGLLRRSPRARRWTAAMLQGEIIVYAVLYVGLEFIVPVIRMQGYSIFVYYLTGLADALVAMAMFALLMGLLATPDALAAWGEDQRDGPAATLGYELADRIPDETPPVVAGVALLCGLRGAGSAIAIVFYLLTAAAFPEYSRDMLLTWKGWLAEAGLGILLFLCARQLWQNRGWAYYAMAILALPFAFFNQMTGFSRPYPDSILAQAFWFGLPVLGAMLSFVIMIAFCFQARFAKGADPARRPGEERDAGALLLERVRRRLRDSGEGEDG